MRKIILIMSAIALAFVMQALVVQSSQAAPPASGPCGYGYNCTNYNYGYNNHNQGYYGYNHYHQNNGYQNNYYNNCNYRPAYYQRNYYKPYVNTCYNCNNRTYRNPHNAYYYYW